jgi:PadR family transcriptional regulator PadR
MSGNGPLDTTQLLKGVLDLAVLAVLADGDGYGYDVVRRLRERGLTEVGDASVYGTLRRLYQAGSLTSYVVPSEEGPHRKYYGLNDRGQKTLDESARTWAQFTRALDQLLNGRSAKHAS